ncbi:MAG: ABC transporter substrate-binding protein [Halobacteriales archaeon]
MASTSDTVRRRTFLKVIGGAAATATVAGCLGDDDDGEPDDTPTDTPGDDTPTDTPTDTPDEDDTLFVWARGSDSSTLDPQATTSGEDAKVMQQIYDRVIDFEPGGSSLREGLAEDFDLSETTVTLTLRQGVEFHNGDEFTADDFVATYRRFVDEDYEAFIGDNQSAYGPYLLGSVDSVSATGDYEVQLELANRYAPMLANLAVFALAVMPQGLIEDGHDFAQDPVGTGAFAFDEWDTGDELIRLEANDDYWGEGPHVDQLVFEAIEENSTRASSLSAGEVHIADGLGTTEIETLENESGVSVERSEGMLIGYMAFNMATVEEFQDRRVRQAISHAIDTEAIVENIYRGFATRADQPVPPTVMGYNEELDPYPYDTDEAESLLAEAGYEDGFSFELATMSNPRPYFAQPVQTAEVVQGNLEDVGIDVSINDFATFDNYLTFTDEGDHDACFLGWISDNGDPDNFHYALLHPGVSQDDVPDGQDWVSWDTEGFNTSNVAAWANTDYMDLIESGQASYDMGEREDLYLQASEIAHEEAPWVYMTYAEEIRGVRDEVSGYVLEVIGGPFLNLVDLE